MTGDSLKQHLLRAQLKAARSRRRIETALALYVAVLAAAAIVVVLAGCGSAAPASTASPSPAPTALTRVQACKALRTDILANGGTPDRATLQQVIDRASSAYLVIDAKAALRDLGDSMAMGFDLAFFQRDCRKTGVQIPQG